MLEQWITRHRASSKAREWLEEGPLRVYVRWTTRLLGGQLVRSLDLATFDVDEDQQGQGVCTRFVQRAEELADREQCYLYVESVLSDRFAKWWQGRGYIQVQDCFYRDPKKIGPVS